MEAEPTAFADRLVVGQDGNKGTRDDSWGFNLRIPGGVREHSVHNRGVPGGCPQIPERAAVRVYMDISR